MGRAADVELEPLATALAGLLAAWWRAHAAGPESVTPTEFVDAAREYPRKNASPTPASCGGRTGARRKDAP